MKKFISIFICLLIFFNVFDCTFAKSNQDIDKIITDTSTYILNTVDNPSVGSIGGEWAILGLARSGIEFPYEYYNKYYANVEQYVKSCNGVLHNKKYTEYSRLILALTSIGKDPQNVAGYNLLLPLADYEKTIWQGINGPVWALIALDCKNYEIPYNPDAKIQSTRELYVQTILDCQLPDGGWSLNIGAQSEKISDPDITAMALQALSKYRNNPKVKKSIDIALNTMAYMQDDKGGFSNYGVPNSESCVQMLVALCELGISIDDTRFVKCGYTILDNLMNYYTQGMGFSHDNDSNSSNLMATEQALYGLVSLNRANTGKNSLYDMSDVIPVRESVQTTSGLKNKSADVCKKEIINHGKTFVDIKDHKNRVAIEQLASRGIINGKSENFFEPVSTMTRAEFATIIVKGLGLNIKTNDAFKDVTEQDWFYDYVNTAFNYGIIKGISDDKFNPGGTITRQEASVMIARAAKLCGMDTNMDDNKVRNVLSQFCDYVNASDWAKSSLAFCYDNDILDDGVMDIEPFETVSRGEIANMLYNMLLKSELL